MSHVVIDMERGVLLRAPVYSQHKGSKNWAATIELDADAPGGVKRDFWKRGGGPARYYRLPEFVRVGTPVEFGADVPSTVSGNVGRRRRRYYGYVLAIDPDTITFMTCVDAREACHFGRAVSSGLALRRAAANKPRVSLLDPDWNEE